MALNAMPGCGNLQEGQSTAQPGDQLQKWPGARLVAWMAP